MTGNLSETGLVSAWTYFTKGWNKKGTCCTHEFIYADGWHVTSMVFRSSTIYVALMWNQTKHYKESCVQCERALKHYGIFRVIYHISSQSFQIKMEFQFKNFVKNPSLIPGKRIVLSIKPRRLRQNDRICYTVVKMYSKNLLKPKAMDDLKMSLTVKSKCDMLISTDRLRLNFSTASCTREGLPLMTAAYWQI